MPTHDIHAQSIRASIGEITNYDAMFGTLTARCNNIIEILYQII